MKLTGMSFTLVMDRPIDKDCHYICPGGYVLNGKSFDFCEHQGTIDSRDRTKVHFFVDDFDEESEYEPIVPADIWGKFEEFFVYTGEPGEPEIHAIGVENIRFYFDGILFNCPKPALDSANQYIRGAA